FCQLGSRTAHWLLRAVREGRPSPTVEETVRNYEQWLGPSLDFEEWGEPAQAAKLEFLAAVFFQLAGRAEWQPTLLAYLQENQLGWLADLWQDLFTIYDHGYRQLSTESPRLPWMFPRFLKQIAPEKVTDVI